MQLSITQLRFSFFQFQHIPSRLWQWCSLAQIQNIITPRRQVFHTLQLLTGKLLTLNPISCLIQEGDRPSHHGYMRQRAHSLRPHRGNFCRICWMPFIFCPCPLKPSAMASSHALNQWKLSWLITNEAIMLRNGKIPLEWIPLLIASACTPHTTQPHTLWENASGMTLITDHGPKQGHKWKWSSSRHVIIRGCESCHRKLGTRFAFAVIPWNGTHEMTLVEACGSIQMWKGWLSEIWNSLHPIIH